MRKARKTRTSSDRGSDLEVEEANSTRRLRSASQRINRSQQQQQNKQKRPRSESENSESSTESGSDTESDNGTGEKQRIQHSLSQLHTIAAQLKLLLSKAGDISVRVPQYQHAMIEHTANELAKGVSYLSPTGAVQRRQSSQPLAADKIVNKRLRIENLIESAKHDFNQSKAASSQSIPTSNQYDFINDGSWHSPVPIERIHDMPTITESPKANRRLRRIPEHMIAVISGYLSLIDVMSMTRVCRDWKRIIDRSLYSLNLELSENNYSRLQLLAFVKKLQNPKNITHFRVHRSRLYGPDLTYILRHLPNITHFEFYSSTAQTSIRDRQSIHSYRFRRCIDAMPNLKSLIICETETFVLQLLPQQILTKLETLKLLLDTPETLIAQIFSHCTNLTSLSLQSFHVSDVRVLDNASLPKLRSLTIRISMFREPILKALLNAVSQIEELQFSPSHDVDLANVVPELGFPNLQRLKMQVDHRSVLGLAEFIRSCPALVKFDITGLLPINNVNNLWKEFEKLSNLTSLSLPMPYPTGEQTASNSLLRLTSLQSLSCDAQLWDRLLSNEKESDVTAMFARLHSILITQGDYSGVLRKLQQMGSTTLKKLVLESTVDNMEMDLTLLSSLPNLEVFHVNKGRTLRTVETIHSQTLTSLSLLTDSPFHLSINCPRLTNIKLPKNCTSAVIDCASIEGITGCTYLRQLSLKLANQISLQINRCKLSELHIESQTLTKLELTDMDASVLSNIDLQCESLISLTLTVQPPAIGYGSSNTTNEGRLQSVVAAVVRRCPNIEDLRLSMLISPSLMALIFSGLRKLRVFHVIVDNEKIYNPLALPLLAIAQQRGNSSSSSSGNSSRDSRQQPKASLRTPKKAPKRRTRRSSDGDSSEESLSEQSDDVKDLDYTPGAKRKVRTPLTNRRRSKVAASKSKEPEVDASTDWRMRISELRKLSPELKSQLLETTDEWNDSEFVRGVYWNILPKAQNLTTFRLEGGLPDMRTLLRAMPKLLHFSLSNPTKTILDVADLTLGLASCQKLHSCQLLFSTTSPLSTVSEVQHAEAQSQQPLANPQPVLVVDLNNGGQVAKQSDTNRGISRRTKRSSANRNNRNNRSNNDSSSDEDSNNNSNSNNGDDDDDDDNSRESVINVANINASVRHSAELINLAKLISNSGEPIDFANKKKPPPKSRKAKPKGTHAAIIAAAAAEESAAAAAAEAAANEIAVDNVLKNVGIALLDRLVDDIDSRSTTDNGSQQKESGEWDWLLGDVSRLRYVVLPQIEQKWFTAGDLHKLLSVLPLTLKTLEINSFRGPVSLLFPYLEDLVLGSVAQITKLVPPLPILLSQTPFTTTTATATTPASECKAALRSAARERLLILQDLQNISDFDVKDDKRTTEATANSDSGSESDTNTDEERDTDDGMSTASAATTDEEQSATTSTSTTTTTTAAAAEATTSTAAAATTEAAAEASTSSAAATAATTEKKKKRETAQRKANVDLAVYLPRLRLLQCDTFTPHLTILSRIFQYAPNLLYLDMEHCKNTTDATLSRVLNSCRRIKIVNFGAYTEMLNLSYAAMIDAVRKYASHRPNNILSPAAKQATAENFLLILHGTVPPAVRRAVMNDEYDFYDDDEEDDNDDNDDDEEATDFVVLS